MRERDPGSGASHDFSQARSRRGVLVGGVALGAGGEVLAEATSMRGSGGRSTAGATVGGEASARFASVLTLDDAALSFDAGTALTFAAGAARRLIASGARSLFLHRAPNVL